MFSVSGAAGSSSIRPNPWCFKGQTCVGSGTVSHLWGTSTKARDIPSCSLTKASLILDPSRTVWRTAPGPQGLPRASPAFGTRYPNGKVKRRQWRRTLKRRHRRTLKAWRRRFSRRYNGKTAREFLTGRDRTQGKRTAAGLEKMDTKSWFRIKWPNLLRIRSPYWHTLKNSSKPWRRLPRNRPWFCRGIISAPASRRDRRRRRGGRQNPSSGLWMCRDPAAGEVVTRRTSTANLELLQLTLYPNLKEPSSITRRHSALRSRVEGIFPHYPPFLLHPSRPVLHRRESVEGHRDELEMVPTGKTTDNWWV